MEEDRVRYPNSPVRATGAVFEASPGPPPVNKGMLGTCFALRDRRHVLTAAHCIAGVSPEDLAVKLPMSFEVFRPPHEIVFHPEADLALLRLGPVEDDAGTALRDVGKPTVGDFMAFGFPPMGMFGEEPHDLEPRLFKGHFQRFIDPFRAEGSPYSYVAGEMSIPAPSGLSGGPVFRPRAPDVVVAMVTANLSTSMSAGEESFEEVLSDGSIRKTVHRHVVNYGIAILLESVRDWLDENVPPATPG